MIHSILQKCILQPQFIQIRDIPSYMTMDRKGTIFNLRPKGPIFSFCNHINSPKKRDLISSKLLGNKKFVLSTSKDNLLQQHFLLQITFVNSQHTPTNFKWRFCSKKTVLKNCFTDF